MKCPKCGNAQTTERRENWRYKESGLSNVVLMGIAVRHCENCDEKIVSIPRIEQLHHLIAMDLATQKATLAPEEIRFLRKELGFSGVEFAHIMGATAETVSRWENGKTPMGASSERLLRLMVQRLEPVESHPLERLADVGQATKRRAAMKLKVTDGEWANAA